MAVTKVKSKWVGGNLVFTDNAGNIIATFDGTLRAFVIGSGAAVLGAVQTLRQRVTTAQVNAGLTLLPAVAGYKYRLVDASAIAIGGAASGLTTLDILGTQATASVKLVAFGQAALTQSALVRAGSSGGVVLADGASFVDNDVNTGITIGKTGSALATATAVDVQLTYILEP
jgi:hypothetical protein